MGTFEERTKTTIVLASAIHQAIVGVQRGGYKMDERIMDHALAVAKEFWLDDYFSGRDGEPKDPRKDDILGSKD